MDLERDLGIKADPEPTADSADWFDVSAESGEPMWQNTKSPQYFSRDQGKTWFLHNSEEGGNGYQGPADGI